MSQLYVVTWPGDHVGTLTPGGYVASLNAHKAKRADDALYAETKHTRKEYLAALGAAVLMDKQAAIKAAKPKRQSWLNDGDTKNPHKLSCVLCDRDAIGTSAQVPTCQQHDAEYAVEGALYLPLVSRPVYLRLIAAYERKHGVYFGSQGAL